MFRVEEFGVDLSRREKFTANDEDLSRDVTGNIRRQKSEERKNCIPCTAKMVAL